MSDKIFVSSSKKDYIGDIKINLDNGQSEYLKIYSNSNSEELAYNFCLKHKIDFTILQKLVEKINFIKNNKLSFSSKEKAEFSFNIRSSIKNKEKNEINRLNNLIFNENNLTPINFINNNQLNNLYDTEETKFKYLSPNNFNNGNITYNGKLEEFNEEKNNFLENKDNDIMSYDLNDSLNDKLNKLEKAYRNYNPENKINNELKGNTKEVIDLTIQECINIVEKEEGNCFNVSSPEYKNNNFVFDKCNNSASLVFKNNILNSKNINNNYLYSTPKIKQKETFCGNNLNNFINKSKFNYNKYEEKDSFKENSKYKEKNKDINYTLSSKEKEHNLILDKKPDDDILRMQKENYNTINVDYYNKNIKDFNDSNVNKNNFKVFNNTCIEHKIDFSLISEKRNYLFLCSNKNIPNNKINYRKTIPKTKNSLSKFNLINKKLYRLLKNSNKSFNSQNKKNVLYNNNDKNHFKTITNYSSLNTIPNYENETPVFSTIKTISNCDPLSSTISDKSTTAQNRVTLVSNSNYSNFIPRGSTTIKLYKYQTIFNSKKIDKIPRNSKNFNFSNELLFNKQKKEKGKETISINYKNPFNKGINVQKNKINLKNINKKLRIRNKKKLIIVNNNIITKNENISSKLLKSNTTSNTTDNNSKKFQIHPLYWKIKNNTISKNKITSNLIEKNEIINSIKNIFKLITKNNTALDAFSMINKNVIPSPIYDVVKKIVRNCDNKKRFIEYDDFINKSFFLFDKFSTEEKISILNYNKYL